MTVMYSPTAWPRSLYVFVTNNRMTNLIIAEKLCSFYPIDNLVTIQ